MSETTALFKLPWVNACYKDTGDMDAIHSAETGFDTSSNILIRTGFSK